MSENHIRPWRNIYRRKSRQIKVGDVSIGGDAPIAVLVTENAWVQITGSDGTVIYENIMLPGEEFVLPQLEVPPKLRAGMSGYVYFSVNGQLFGPVGSGTSVRKNVELSAASIVSNLQTPELSNKKLIAELISEGKFPSLQKFKLD